MDKAYEKIIDNVLSEARKIIMDANAPRRMEITLELNAGQTPLIRYEIEGARLIKSQKKEETDGN